MRLEDLDNEDFDNLDEVPRETGDIDLFNPKLIPLKDNSYLGQFLVWSGLIMVFKVAFPFINLMINETL